MLSERVPSSSVPFPFLLSPLLHLPRLGSRHHLFFICHPTPPPHHRPVRASHCPGSLAQQLAASCLFLGVSDLSAFAFPHFIRRGASPVPSCPLSLLSALCCSAQWRVSSAVVLLVLFRPGPARPSPTAAVAAAGLGAWDSETNVSASCCLPPSSSRSQLQLDWILPVWCLAPLAAPTHVLASPLPDLLLLLLCGNALAFLIPPARALALRIQTELQAW